MKKINKILLRNDSGLEFEDISTEKYRIYSFEERSIRIDRPLYLNVSKSGGHRILDQNEVSHYIPGGWIHLRWKSFKNSPHFVK